MKLTASMGADKLQPDCPLGLARLPVEDNVPVIIIVIVCCCCCYYVQCTLTCPLPQGRWCSKRPRRSSVGQTGRGHQPQPPEVCAWSMEPEHFIS